MKYDFQVLLFRVHMFLTVHFVLLFEVFRIQVLPIVEDVRFLQSYPCLLCLQEHPYRIDPLILNPKKTE